MPTAEILSAVTSARCPVLDIGSVSLPTLCGIPGEVAQGPPTP